MVSQNVSPNKEMSSNAKATKTSAPGGSANTIEMRRLLESLKKNGASTADEHRKLTGPSPIGFAESQTILRNTGGQTSNYKAREKRLDSPELYKGFKAKTSFEIRLD